MADGAGEVGGSGGENDHPVSSPSALPSHFGLHDGSHADLFLYTDVTNISHLLSLFHRQQLRATPLNPSLIPDLFPLLVALVKAAAAAKHKAIKTKDVYNEVAFNLSPSTHIQTAVERFLPSPTDGRLLLVCLNSAVADVLEVQRLVEGGRRQPLSTLPAQADYAALRQLYKITDAELQLPPSPSYSNAITMRIATK